MNILSKFNLEGKVALVTGAARGIGNKIAHALCQAGARVALVDQDSTQLNIACREFQAYANKFITIHADIRKIRDIKNMMKEITFKWKMLDIAVNNAGIGYNIEAENTTEKLWDDIMDVNLKGVFRCCQAEGECMFANEDGVIINIASMSSLIIPHPQKQIAYNTSKAGVVQLTKTLACEWASKNIRVNCISPGIVETPLINTVELKHLKDQWIQQNPTGRLATVDDITGGVIFLASSASQYITGHNLVIDGGHTLW